MSHINTLAKPKAEMKLRVYRADTNTWEDGPTVGAVLGLGFFKNLKVAMLLRAHALLSRLLKKLENLR